MGTARTREDLERDLHKARAEIERLRENSLAFDQMMDGYAHHKVILNDAGDPIDYRYLRVNSVFEGIVGVNSEEVINKRVRSIFPEIEDEWIKNFGQVAITGKPHRFEDYFAHLEKWFDVVAFQTKPLHFACIFRDITREKQTEERRRELESQLHQAQKMEAMGTLAGGIAHDFNNILSPITGYSELALAKLAEGDIIGEELLTPIHISAIRASKLVKQILNFSRDRDEEIRPVSIRAIIKESIPLIRAATTATIEIKLCLESDKLVMGNSTQIQGIIINLCVNAAQAMNGSGGVISIELAESAITGNKICSRLKLPSNQSYLLLSVNDTGCGMKQHIVDRIFDPYFTTRDQCGGTGLGLSIVHTSVKNLGGAIRVESTPGKGTTINICLPIVDAPREEIEVLAEPSPLGNERILIVDDEEMILNLERRMLENLGYEVVSQAHPFDALALFLKDLDQGKKFDLVIADMGLPKITGEELIAQMKALAPDLSTIICTGFSEVMNEHYAKEVGINGFIMKPIVTREIARLVREVLDRD